MPRRQRYRFQDQPINMLTGRYTADCTKPKPATNPAENYSARRRPITLEMMNKIAREFWARKENQL
jgi:hypothetical protein